MRIWIAISAYVLLAFALFAILLALTGGAQPVSLLINLLIVALAVHDIVYLRVAKTDPVRGYRHLAAGQFLIGLLISVLVAAMAIAAGDNQIWQLLRDALSELLALFPQLQGVTPAQLDQAMLETRHIAITAFNVGAAIIFISQTAFALLVLRKAKPDEPK